MNKFEQKSSKYLKFTEIKKKKKIKIKKKKKKKIRPLQITKKKKEFHKRNNEQNIKLLRNERIILHFIKKYKSEAKNNNEKKK